MLGNLDKVLRRATSLPVSVVPWSVYETMYKNGKYVPYSDEKLKKVIIYIKKRIHPWVRLNRVIRDIPISYISGGCSQPNMRQSLSKLCKCKCIRCREVKGRKIGKAYRKYIDWAILWNAKVAIAYCCGMTSPIDALGARAQGW